MSLLRSFYDGIIKFGCCFQHLFLLLIRLYWGYAFYLAGSGKLSSISKITNFFGSIGIPFPEFNANLVAYVETVGGFMLIAGFASRLAAIPLAITMIVALFTAHYEGVMAIFQMNGEFIKQTPVTYLLVTLAVLCFGPGAISVDAILKRLFSRQDGR